MHACRCCWGVAPRRVFASLHWSCLFIWCAKLTNKNIYVIQSLFLNGRKINHLWCCLFDCLLACLLVCLLLVESAFTNPPISGYILFHLRNVEASKLPAPFPDVQSPLRKRSACFALSNEQLGLKKVSFQSIKIILLRKGEKKITKHQFLVGVLLCGCTIWGAGESHFFCKISSSKDPPGGFLLR